MGRLPRLLLPHFARPGRLFALCGLCTLVASPEKVEAQSVSCAPGAAGASVVEEKPGGFAGYWKDVMGCAGTTWFAVRQDAEGYREYVFDHDRARLMRDLIPQNNFRDFRSVAGPSQVDGQPSNTSTTGNVVEVLGEGDWAFALDYPRGLGIRRFASQAECENGRVSIAEEARAAWEWANTPPVVKLPAENEAVLRAAMQPGACSGNGASYGPATSATGGSAGGVPMSGGGSGATGLAAPDMDTPEGLAAGAAMATALAGGATPQEAALIGEAAGLTVEAAKFVAGLFASDPAARERMRRIQEAGLSQFEGVQARGELVECVTLLDPTSCDPEPGELDWSTGAPPGMVECLGCYTSDTTALDWARPEDVREGADLSDTERPPEWMTPEVAEWTCDTPRSELPTDELEFRDGWCTGGVVEGPPSAIAVMERIARRNEVIWEVRATIADAELYADEGLAWSEIGALTELLEKVQIASEPRT